MSNLELAKSAVDNATNSFKGLDIINKALVDIERKGLTLANAIKLFHGGITFYISTENACNDVKQIANNISVEIQPQQPVINYQMPVALYIQNPLLGLVLNQSEINSSVFTQQIQG